MNEPTQAGPVGDAEKMLAAIRAGQADAVLGEQGLMVLRLAATEAERNRLLAAVEQAGEAIVITDQEGRVRYANAACEQLLGQPRERLVGGLLDLLTEGVDSAVRTAVWAALQAGQRWQGRVTLAQGASQRTEEVTVSPVHDAAGCLVACVAVRADVTARVELEEQLRQAQKMEAVGRLAGGIAHDFNNMLAVILGHTALVLDELPADGAWREDLLAVQAAAERSAELTRQLLGFARRQPIRPTAIDLNTAVAEVLRMLPPLLGEGLTVRWLPAADLPTVCADAGQIGQVIVNLCLNSRDSITPPGTITIATALAAPDQAGLPPGGTTPWLQLVVSDDGCGMSAETLAHAFEPFYTTKPLGAGTGLGLAMVHGAAHQNGGTVTIESQLGVGTRVTVFLPACCATVPPPTAGTRPSGGRSLEILLVEDEAAVLRLVGRVLSSHGHCVHLAASAAEALALCEQRRTPFDLLLTDVRMPDLSGPALADRLAARGAAQACLFMSGYAADEVDLTHGGAHRGFIQKPFTPEDLLAKIRQLRPAT